MDEMISKYLVITNIKNWLSKTIDVSGYSDDQVSLTINTYTQSGTFVVRKQLLWGKK